ncbi:ribose-5-phosphate isomerase RpiA [Candidatus Symbiobacter mobilis]|uniref:Ribose-5-phosphate isomerase A n=1 Tax=Candidatus Symbiobacter mobilis CR TaxID=946483 RepID=U5N777_9BURK|nr:ribose-5-phosphate isomerase RpiA [Candidatus Symbiobacter mobilis]AGX87160.1 ribose 5-phosphate isomerase A [Candidatus Symbiobacter mobilis CR]
MQALSQQQLKTLVGEAALEYVSGGEIIGVGTGSTVNCFLHALERIRDRIKGAVSTSPASTALLRELGIPVLDPNDVDELGVYIDGADEIDHHGYMIKGGGAALTLEKIVAAQSRRFVCIADESKLVDLLGTFPLPVEVLPVAERRIVRQFEAMGAQATIRQCGGAALLTNHGMHIVDVRGLQITDPLLLEAQVSQWPGVVTVGIFARQKAHVCLLGTGQGVRTLTFCA